MSGRLSKPLPSDKAKDPVREFRARLRRWATPAPASQESPARQVPRVGSVVLELVRITGAVATMDFRLEQDRALVCRWLDDLARRVAR